MNKDNSLYKDVQIKINNFYKKNKTTVLRELEKTNGDHIYLSLPKKEIVEIQNRGKADFDIRLYDGKNGKEWELLLSYAREGILGIDSCPQVASNYEEEPNKLFFSEVDKICAAAMVIENADFLELQKENKKRNENDGSIFIW